MSENTVENRPGHLFKPGQSGNPNGRPKGAGISITTAIKRELERRPDGADEATYLDQLVKKIMHKAIKEGDQQMIKQVWNYVDGMPEQSHELNASGGFTLNIAKEIADKNETTPDTESDSKGQA